ASAGAAACPGDAGHGGVDRRPDRGRRSPRRAVVLAAALDGAMGESAWRLCAGTRADRPDCGRCSMARGGCVATGAGAALDGIRVRRTGGRLLHALWLELAARVGKDSCARRGVAADPGMGTGEFRQYWRARNLPAARA